MTHLVPSDFTIISTGGSNAGIIGPDGSRIDTPGELTTRTGNSSSIIQRFIDSHNEQTIPKLEITSNQIISQTKSFFSNPLVIIGAVAIGLFILTSGRKRK